MRYTNVNHILKPVRSKFSTFNNNITIEIEEILFSSLILCFILGQNLFVIKKGYVTHEWRNRNNRHPIAVHC